MHYSTRASAIEYNHMYGAGYLTDDCGITYCWSSGGEGTTIAYNCLYLKCL